MCVSIKINIRLTDTYSSLCWMFQWTMQISPIIILQVLLYETMHWVITMATVIAHIQHASRVLGLANDYALHYTGCRNNLKVIN